MAQSKHGIITHFIALQFSVLDIILQRYISQSKNLYTFNILSVTDMLWNAKYKESENSFMPQNTENLGPIKWIQ